MKRKITVLLSVLLLVAALTPMALAEGMSTAYVTGGSLRMRADTSKYSDIIGVIPNGGIVAIQEYYAGGTWAYVEYNGKLGYVMSRYLSRTAPTPKPSPSPTPAEDLTRIFEGFQDTDYTAYVRGNIPGGFVHMRWAPSQKMKIMCNFYEGNDLEVIAQNNTWCQVRDPYTGKTGFIMRSFLLAGGVGANGAVEQ